MIVLAARAAGIGALDGVHLDLSDEALFAGACEQGRAIGFDGKTLIHPKTIATANDAFSPSRESIAEAYQILQAHEEAEREGKGVVLVNGRLIEGMHVAQARKLIQFDERIKSKV